MRAKWVACFDGKLKAPPAMAASPCCRCPCGTTWAQGRALAFQTPGGSGSSNRLGVTEAKGRQWSQWSGIQGMDLFLGFGHRVPENGHYWKVEDSHQTNPTKQINQVFSGFKFTQIPLNGRHGPVTSCDYGFENLTAAGDRISCCWSHVQTNFQRTLVEMKWSSLSWCLTLISASTKLMKFRRETVSEICQLILEWRYNRNRYLRCVLFGGCSAIPRVCWMVDRIILSWCGMLSIVRVCVCVCIFYRTSILQEYRIQI